MQVAHAIKLAASSTKKNTYCTYQLMNCKMITSESTGYWVNVKTKVSRQIHQVPLTYMHRCFMCQ